MKAMHFLLIGALAAVSPFLFAGCSTPKKLEYPDVDPHSQQDQMQRKVSRLTKSPYVRSGI